MIQYILGLCTYLKHLDIFKHIIFMGTWQLSNSQNSLVLKLSNNKTQHTVIYNQAPVKVSTYLMLHQTKRLLTHAKWSGYIR